MDKKYNTQEELLAAFSSGAITHEQYKQLLDEITNNPKISEYSNLDELKRALAIGKITMQQYKSYLEELNPTDEKTEITDTPEKPEVEETPLKVDTVETPTTQEDNQETTTQYDSETLKLDLASGKITMQQYKNYLEELNSTDKVSEVEETPLKVDTVETPTTQENNPETTTQFDPETLKLDLASGKITMQQYKSYLEELNSTDEKTEINDTPEKPEVDKTPLKVDIVETPTTQEDNPETTTQFDPETLKLDLASGKITMQQYKSYLEELNPTDEVSEVQETPEKPVVEETPENTTQYNPETLKLDLASGKITMQQYKSYLEELNPTNPKPPIQEQPDTVVTPTASKTVEAPYTKPDIPNKNNNKKYILILITLIITLTSIILGFFYITNYTGFTTVDVSEIYVTGYTTDGFKATPQVIFIPDHYKGNDITMYQDELDALSDTYNVDTSTVTAPSYDQTTNDKLGLIGLEYALSSEQPIAEGQETQINISYDEKLAKEQKIKLTGIELEASEYLVSPTGLYTQATVDKIDPEMLLASSIFEDELIDKAFYNPSNYTSKEVLHVSSWIKQDSISNEEFLENPEEAGMDVVGFYETKGKRSGDLELQYCIITMPGIYYSPDGLVQPYGYSDDDDTTIEHISQCTDWETRGLTGWPKYLKDEGYEQIGGALN